MENTATETTAISVPIWAWLLVAAVVMSIYAMTMDNGVVLSGQAMRVHELVHDARHFVGMPCH